MKNAILLISLMVGTLSFSQTGKIYLKSADFKAGANNTYVYEPPTGTTVPEGAMVNVITKQFLKKSIALVKNDLGYEFTIAVPDSITALVMTVTDKKKGNIDNNADKGYVLYLNCKTETALDKAKLTKLGFDGYTNQVLKLKNSDEETIAAFDKLYARHPEYKKDESFGGYLYLQSRKDKEKYKLEVMKYAEGLVMKGDENNLLGALNMYSWYAMFDKQNEIGNLIVKKHPMGQFAKNKFIGKLYKIKDIKEQTILYALKEFTVTFNDSSQQNKEQFYNLLIQTYIANNDTLNFKKYARLVQNKLNTAAIYNNYAWELSGQDLITPAKYIDFAVSISKQSKDILHDRLLQPTENDDVPGLQNLYITYTDTYALLMFKQKKYDLAFQYQDEISKMDEIDTGGKERYAGYAEKAKGLEFTKTYIENQLNNGIQSIILLAQLEEIYRKLNLPMSGLDLIKANAQKLAVQKTKDDIIKTFGSLKAIDFTLTNLAGKNVKLSDYKGKVVVLDFWATWCGPCRRSFPKMQELVTKYKNDKVEFFFVDVWERAKPEKIKETVTAFIKENKYSFNVLLDYEDAIVAKYKIRGVPTRIVIDTNGEIISNSASEEELPGMIDELLN